MTIYEIYDSKDKCLMDGFSLEEIRDKLVNEHQIGQLEREPDIAKIVKYEGEKEEVLSLGQLAHFISELSNWCDFTEYLPEDGMTQAKAKDGY